MKIKRLFPIFVALSLIVLPACFGNNEDNDFSEWRTLNLEYFASMETATENGVLVYEKITPVWDNSFSILLHRHNSEENESEIMPLSNSTCHVKYTLTNINGDTLDSSASFTCVPNNMVTGFMAALCTMRVNDTVTAIIPYTAGYGAYSYGSVLPYSTLVFGIRLDSISKLM